MSQTSDIRKYFVQGTTDLLGRLSRSGFHTVFYSVNALSEFSQSTFAPPRYLAAWGEGRSMVGRWSKEEYKLDPIRRLFSKKQLQWKSTLPFVWENKNGKLNLKSVRLSASESDYLQSCYRAGVCTAVNVPIHTPDGNLILISSFSDKELAYFDRHPDIIRDVFYTSHQLHKGLPDEVTENDRTQDHPPLSPRERECMEWAARGKNAGEIATILGISAMTVRDHFKNASAKLKTVTRGQAIAKLCATGALKI